MFESFVEIGVQPLKLPAEDPPMLVLCLQMPPQHQLVDLALTFAIEVRLELVDFAENLA